jgi:hypothetical protein
MWQVEYMPFGKKGILPLLAFGQAVSGDFFLHQKPSHSNLKKLKFPGNLKEPAYKK